MTENSASLGVPPRAGPPDTYWLDPRERRERIENSVKQRCAKEISEGRLKFQRAMTTPDNIDSLLRGGGMSGEIDFLSLDIVGNDYHVWKAISVIQPRVVCIEYNAKFRPPFDWIMPATTTTRRTDRIGLESRSQR
jgi:hypothetical protein